MASIILESEDGVYGDENIGCTDKVRCECGSEVMLKNLKAHKKTKKHINGGKIIRATPEEMAEKKKAANEGKKLASEEKASVPGSTTTMRDKIMATGKVAKPSAEEDEDDIDLILGDLATLMDKVDHLTSMVDQGFSVLLGEESLEDIPEEDTSPSSSSSSKGKVVKK